MAPSIFLWKGDNILSQHTEGNIHLPFLSHDSYPCVFPVSVWLEVDIYTIRLFLKRQWILLFI